MDTEPLRQRLIRAARGIAPDDRVPPAFEARVMASLRSRPSPDPISLWTTFLWRAVAPCGAIMLAVSLGTLLFADPSGDDVAVPGYAVLLADFDTTEVPSP